MALSMAAPCSPNSLHLRLAMNWNCSHKSTPGLLPTPPRKIHSRLRILRLFPPPNETPFLRCPNASSLVAPPSSLPDSFAGWSNSDNSPNPNPSTELPKKKWVGFEGIVVGGVAGVVLIVGLTFAAFSLNKRNISRPKQEMEALTSQQEVFLDSDQADGEAAHTKSKESGVGIHLYHTSTFLPAQLDEASPSREKVSSQEVLENGSDCDDKLVTPEVSSFEKVANNPIISDVSLEEDGNKSVISEITPTLRGLPSSGIATDLSGAVPKPSAAAEESSVNAEPADLTSTTSLNTGHATELPGPKVEENSIPLKEFSDSNAHEPSKLESESNSITSPGDIILSPQALPKDDTEAATAASPTVRDNFDQSERPRGSMDRYSSSLEASHSSECEPAGTSSVSAVVNPFADVQDVIANNEVNERKSFIESPAPASSFSSAGIPAPSVISAALQVLPGMILIPATIDQVQGQAFAALQVLKVIEADVQPGDLCTRREYARWLVAASSALSRRTVSKVYPAMYIEEVTELAFDDITPDDPDFSSIQGLAEAGLISSKLSNCDLLSSLGESQYPFYFTPESPLSRQDLVTWKMALEKRQLPEADTKMLYSISGFRDIDRINPDAWPALVADLSAGDQGIIALAFGCTRLFQPHKPVTKAQAAVALATGEASDIVSEELARIEADSMAENAVYAHNALVAQVEKDVNASFEKELVMEREKINSVEKMAEEARQELEWLRAQCEKDNIALIKERAAIESEMEVLSRLRREVEEQLQSLTSNKVEISYEKERISKLQIEAENEKQEISRLQYELEVERKALSIARAWAEDEAKRAREQAKALEEARERWQRQGIKVVVDSDLQEESSAGATWLTASKQYSEGAVSRAENLVDRLKLLADDVRAKSRIGIDNIICMMLHFISTLKEWALEASLQAKRFKDATALNAMGSIKGLQKSTTELSLAIKEKATGSVQELQQSTVDFGLAVKEGAKRVAGDCWEGVEKISQKFKS